MQHPFLKKVWKVLKELKDKAAHGMKLIWTDKDYRLFAIVYLVQGSLGLTTVSFPLFLKDELGLTAFQITTLMASYGILWFIKPLYGAISDALPIFKLRRKPYIFFFSALSTVAWGLVAFYPPTYNLVFVALFLQSLGFAFTDVVVDGLAVQKSTKKTAGKIQSIMWGSRMTGMMISGFLGGYLINIIGYQNIFAIVALMPVLVLITTIFVDEEKVESVIKRSKSFFTRMKDSFQKLTWDTFKKGVIEAKPLIFASVFIFIFNMFPHFTTSNLAPFIIFMKDSLNFSDSLLGALVTVMSLGKLLGVIIYALFLDGVDLRKILKWSVIAGSIVTLFALILFNPFSAVIIHLCWGIIGYISFLPVMKLAVRSCPKDMEATVFALLMSVGNFGNTFATFSSGYVYEFYGLNALILMAAIGGLLALPFIKYLKEEKKDDDDKKGD